MADERMRSKSSVIADHDASRGQRAVADINVIAQHRRAFSDHAEAASRMNPAPRTGAHILMYNDRSMMRDRQTRAEDVQRNFKIKQK